MDSETVSESEVWKSVGEGVNKEIYAAEWVEDILTGKHQARPDDEIAVGHFINPLKGRQPATIPYDSLLRGFLNIGQCGVGKSTLTDNMLIQMAEDGYGFCHIDMKGEIQDLIQQIPENRMDDIEIIGSYNKEPQQGIDILENPPDDEDINRVSESFADIVGEEITGVPKEFTKGIGKIALSNGMDITDILDMIHSDPKGDIEVHKDYYGPILDKILSLDPDNTEILPVIRRIQDIVETPVLRRTIADDNGVSLYDAVSNEKIILVSPNAALDLDLKKKILHATLRKMINVFEHIHTNEDMGKFFISIDEADYLDISGYNLEWYFAKARSYNVGVLLTIQYLNQMEDKTTVLSNMGNLISFRHSEIETTNRLTAMLNVENRDEVMNIEAYTALTRLNAKHGIFNKQISTFPQLKPRRETYTP